LGVSAAEWPIEIDPQWGCWLWTKAIDKRDGYGLVWRGPSPMKAHRVVYEAEVGPIPEGLVLEHRCRVRRCVRPSHLLPVTQSENLYRRRWDVRVMRDLCAAKHDGIHAMVLPTGGRLCRLCDR
jgi:hypothetical protein